MWASGGEGEKCQNENVPDWLGRSFEQPSPEVSARKQPSCEAEQCIWPGWATQKGFNRWNRDSETTQKDNDAFLQLSIATNTAFMPRRFSNAGRLFAAESPPADNDCPFTHFWSYR
jgi:hypothetical protein